MSVRGENREARIHLRQHEQYEASPLVVEEGTHQQAQGRPAEGDRLRALPDCPRGPAALLLQPVEALAEQVREHQQRQVRRDTQQARLARVEAQMVCHKGGHLRE